jgi:hypothetical protein
MAEPQWEEPARTSWGCVSVVVEYLFKIVVLQEAPETPLGFGSALQRLVAQP